MNKQYRPDGSPMTGKALTSSTEKKQVGKKKAKAPKDPREKKYSGMGLKLEK